MALCLATNNLKMAWWLAKNENDFFLQKKTPSISYKIIQMGVLYTNPYRDAIVPSYVDAHWPKKGRGQPLLDDGKLLSLDSIGAAL